MIKQLIDRLGGLQAPLKGATSREQAEKHLLIAKGIQAAIEEAKKLQEKVRCENCRHEGYCDYADNTPDMANFLHNIDDLTYCSAWEEKE